MAPLNYLLSGIIHTIDKVMSKLDTHGKGVERASSSTDHADLRPKLHDLLDMSFHIPHLQKKKIVLVYKPLQKINEGMNIKQHCSNKLSIGNSSDCCFSFIITTTTTTTVTIVFPSAFHIRSDDL